MYQLSNYSFSLPDELIAQTPIYPRDRSRLMILNRQEQSITEIPFFELEKLLKAGDALIFNNTKVIPARLLGNKESGGQVEVFLSKEITEGLWEVLLRPAKKVKVGTKIVFSPTFSGKVLEKYSDGINLIKFHSQGSFKEELIKSGKIPLPSYIKRDGNSENDIRDYQTLFAKKEGAVAAPTAGLHFTSDLLNQLEEKHVHLKELTLHVGLGTFKPVVDEDIRNHKMHKEYVEISESTADFLNHHKNQLQIAIGTTSCRALESACAQDGLINPGNFETNLFIYPGYQFKCVKALLTNFHLPGSSLLMLVSAFAGYDFLKEAYQKAIKEKFRFYSYGDAMLII